MTAPENLTAALAAVQANLPVIPKNKTAKVPMKAGGTYSYKYADLADMSTVVLPLLAANGLAFACHTTAQDGSFVLIYQLRHTSGEMIEGSYPLPDPAHTTPQQVGSALTYARRYAFGAITGVVPDEDDDGQGAKDTTAKPRQSRQAKPELYRDDKKADRGPAAGPDPWRASDPVAVQEWRDVVAACGDKDALASAWSDLTALTATGQIAAADKPGLIDVWQARKAEVMEETP